MAQINPAENLSIVPPADSTLEANTHTKATAMEEDEAEAPVTPLKDSAEGKKQQLNNTPGIKLIIYDFDQTITTEHLYRELHGGKLQALSKLSDGKLLEVFGGQDRLKSLTRHLQHLYDAHTVIAILSFGWSDVIDKALQRVELAQFFDAKLIFGRDSPDMLIFNRNKGKAVKKLMRQRNLSFNQVLFVDDAKVNVQQTQEFCRTLHVESRCGISCQDMANIESQLYVHSAQELEAIRAAKESVSKVDGSGKDGAEGGAKTHRKKPSKLEKYKPKVPTWFDNLQKKDDSPVIEIHDATFSDIVLDKPDIKIAPQFTFGGEEEAPQ